MALALLSVFGWAVKHRTQGDLDLGRWNGPLEWLAGSPDLFQASLEEVQALPQTFVPTPEAWSPIHALEEDLWALSAYSNVIFAGRFTVL